MQQTPNSILLSGGWKQSRWVMAFILATFLVIFFGSRDPDSFAFADTVGYAARYYSIQTGGTSSVWYVLMAEQTNELVWTKLLIGLARMDADVSVWFTIIAAVYIYAIVIAMKYLVPEQVYFACLCGFLNFGFYSGATNGIRNGMGLSLVLLSMALIIANQYSLKFSAKTIISFSLLIVAFQIHSSTALPSLCLITSIYFIKKPKWTMLIWILSFAVSLVFGNYAANILAGLGFDDRMSYLAEGSNMEMMKQTFSHVGFRWDFLLFSAVPVFWGWYVIKHIGLNDRAYNVIFSTYLLANSFWIIVIRAAFSNRFAALSWFLYFLVLIYPLLKHSLIPRQGELLAVMLIGLLLINIVI